MSKVYYTYIITNYSKSVLYTGITDNLVNRLLQHYSKRGTLESFASKYSCFYLVWYDHFQTPYEAIRAEKYIKGKTRTWKENLIKDFNPEWKFLNREIVGVWPPNQDFMKSINT